MDVKVIKIPETGFAGNCYVIFSEETKAGIIVDPAIGGKEIVNMLEKEGIDLKYILLTHAHVDHFGAVPEIKELLDIELLIHEDDADQLLDEDLNFSKQMFPEPISLKADRLLKDEEILKVEDMEFKVIHTPGHTKGGICLSIGNILITGDTLFAGSIGRTDFYGGDFDTIISSIKEKLFQYPDNTVILPGHGEQSTIGREKQVNPFVR